MTPIEWRGDLEDDCSAKVGNLLAHCERLADCFIADADEPRKRSPVSVWYVSVCPVDENNRPTGDDLFHSGEPGGLIIGGTMARAIAEAIIRAYARPVA